MAGSVRAGMRGKGKGASVSGLPAASVVSPSTSLAGRARRIQGGMGAKRNGSLVRGQSAGLGTSRRAGQVDFTILPDDPSEPLRAPQASGLFVSLSEGVQSLSEPLRASQASRWRRARRDGPLRVGPFI